MTALMCVVCLTDVGVVPQEALAIVQGYSVCGDHAELIGFTRPVKRRIAERQEEKQREAEMKEKTVT